MLQTRCTHALRTLLAAMMLGVLTLTSGCFSGDVNVVIHEDGSADLKTTLVSVPMLAELVEQSKTAALEKNPEAQVTPVEKENMSGYEISEHFNNVEGLSAQDFFAAHEGKNTGITATKNLFYDDYNFDLLFEGNDDQSGAGAFASGITFTYQMTLPVVPTSSNADRTEMDGKLLTWNLGKTLTTGESSKIQVAYRIWHKGAIAATAIVVLLLLGALVFYILRRRKSAEEEPQQLIEDVPIEIHQEEKQ
jgi:hypothetical protein